MNYTLDEEHIGMADRFDFELNEEKAITLLIDYDNQSTLDFLKGSDRQYIQKMLSTSGPDNWATILAILNEYDVDAVLIKIKAPTLVRMCRDEYKSIRNSLFDVLEKIPHQIYIYQGLINFDVDRGYYSKLDLGNEVVIQAQKEGIVFGGTENDASHQVWESYYNKNYNKVFESLCNQAIDYLNSMQLNIIPYWKNADLTIISHEYISDLEKHILFRLYIPNEKLWAEEHGKMISLFQDYLNRVYGLEIRLEIRQSVHGNIYELQGTLPIEIPEIEIKVSEFGEFLDLLSKDNESARCFLESRGVNDQEINRLLSKYKKEAKRLLMDLKHDRERKVTNLKHKIEYDLTEYDLSEHQEREMKELISELESILVASLEHPFQIPQVINNYHSQSGNQQIIHQTGPAIVGTAISEIIYGIKYKGDALEIYNLINQYGKNKNELEIALSDMTEITNPATKKRNAAAKIKSFLYSLSNDAKDIGKGLIQTYIESQLGL